MSPISWGDVDWYNLGREMTVDREPLYLTLEDEENIRGVNAMLQLARSQPPHKREAFYKAAGQHLELLRRNKSVEIWAEIVRENCGIGLSRAYELVAIGQGKRLVDLRAQKGASDRRWKAENLPKKRNTETKSMT